MVLLLCLLHPGLVLVSCPASESPSTSTTAQTNATTTVSTTVDTSANTTDNSSTSQPTTGNKPQTLCIAPLVPLLPCLWYFCYKKCCTRANDNLWLTYRQFDCRYCCTHSIHQWHFYPYVFYRYVMFEMCSKKWNVLEVIPYPCCCIRLSSHQHNYHFPDSWAPP